MKIGNIEVTNPLEVIQCIMAFDSRDWFSNERDRMLYAIVFGISDDEIEQYKNVGYTDYYISEYKKLHERYEELLES